MTASTAFATPLSSSQARARIMKQVSMKGLGGSESVVVLSHTGRIQSSGMAAYYVFSVGSDGFVVASADDELPAVLGYSGSSTFNSESIPENVQWWLDEYVRQIEWMYENSIMPVSSVVYNAPNHPTIEPLVKTSWGQEIPYNENCPMVGTDRTFTGCVATAMAQIMKCHQWPTQGTGTHSYTWNGQTISFDYGATTFAWDKMQDVYKSNVMYSQDRRQSVAVLMSACGVSVDMDYGVDASGAYSDFVSYALVNNFGYDKGAAFLIRDYFTADEWDEWVYSDLKRGCPVYYSGASTYSSHAFVCDGYDGDGYYHINWGWSGQCDGYFLLSVLDPYGAGNGYKSDQRIVCRIQKPVSDSSLFLPVYADGDFQYRRILKGFWFTTDGAKYGFYWNGRGPITLSVGLKFVAQDGSVLYVSEGDKEFSGMVNGRYTYDCRVIEVDIPSAVPAGTYKVYPVVSVPGSGVWSPIYIRQGNNQYVGMTVTANGSVTFDNNASVDTIGADECSLVDVYNLQGVRVRLNVDPNDATSGLPAGIYIVGGRKVVVN